LSHFFMKLLIFLGRFFFDIFSGNPTSVYICLFQIGNFIPKAGFGEKIIFCDLSFLYDGKKGRFWDIDNLFPAAAGHPPQGDGRISSDSTAHFIFVDGMSSGKFLEGVPIDKRGCFSFGADVRDLILFKPYIGPFFNKPKRADNKENYENRNNFDHKRCVPILPPERLFVKKRLRGEQNIESHFRHRGSDGEN